MTLPESAPEAANASNESGEKPLYIWNPRTVRARKWKERREKRKLKKQRRQQEEAEEAETEDDESDEEVEQEPVDQKKAVKKKKKKRKRSTEEGVAASQAENPQDDSAAAAAQLEAPDEAPQKKKRKKSAADKSNADEQAAPVTGDTENVAADPEAEAEAEAQKAKAQQEALDVQQSIHAKGFFSEQRYEDLPIVDPLKRALKDNNFVMLTEIQAKSIPLLLNGKDVLAAAKTGSGKTLAFLVPAIDLLHRVKFLPRNGVGAVVISPVRELAQQIYDVLRNISAHVSQTHGVCVGGMNRKNESEKLAKGVNILVATPGRLLDHMQNTKGFVYHNLVNLTIDEADRILEVGFEEEINLIIKMLPKKRQTALFSATQTRKVADLARLSLTKPVFVEVKSKDNVATVQGLTQGYVVCPAAHRFLLLFTFLKRNRDKKVMVFFSSCNSVKFHDELLNYIDIPTVCIHGHKKQAARSSTYYQFCSADKGLLLCTDVAARGLDIPKVDWIVQFDPPDEPKEYIHRVGRTARGADGQGKALLFLMPEELGFLQYLRRAGVPVSEYTFPSSKLSNIQSQLERVIEKNYHLHRSSRDAYRSYMHAYAAHSHKDCFDVYKLDLQQVAKAFGFMHPPKVDLNLKHTGRDKKKGQKKTSAIKQTSQSLKPRADGVTPAAANQYGVATNDKRQFNR